jgi:prophage regulatory protein
VSFGIKLVIFVTVSRRNPRDIGATMTDNKVLRALRRKQVLDKTGKSTSGLYEDMARGRFPRPFHDGRAVRWLEHEVDSWLAERAAERDAKQKEAPQ